MSDLTTISDFPAAPAQINLPVLQPGDHLSRGEFERRYARMPHVKKAELIEGVVYMPSPVSKKKHGNPQGRFITWIGHYEAFTPGVEIADNSTVRLDWDNEPQPDAMLLISPDCGGQTRDEDGYVALAPEWLGEIAASSKSYDLHQKKEAYRRNGVREYVVWRVDDKAIDWFVFREGVYENLEPDDDGIHRSEVFPGLWLDATALLAGDMKRVLAVLQQGIEHASHAEFVMLISEEKSQNAE